MVFCSSNFFRLPYYLFFFIRAYAYLNENYRSINNDSYLSLNVIIDRHLCEPSIRIRVIYKCIRNKMATIMVCFLFFYHLRKS